MIPFDVPPIKPVPIPGFEPIITVIGWIAFLIGIAAVIGLFAIVINMFLKNKRGQGDEHVERLGIWVFACILASAGGLITGALLVFK